MSLISLLKSLFSSGPGLTVSFGELNTALAEGRVRVVDVREPHEFVTGTVPGAINMPLSVFNPARLPAGKPVVLICHAGMRSRRALSRAVKAGRSDVRHYAGGICGWRRAGGKAA
jgi:rhodanese-related sulfurtransferase